MWRCGDVCKGLTPLVMLMTFAAFTTFGSGCDTYGGGIVGGLDAQILHADGSITSGAGELWYSPRLEGDQESEWYASLFEGELAPFYRPLAVEDAEGRRWLACRGEANDKQCGFNTLDEKGGVFDLKLRTAGPLAEVVFEEAPWEKAEEVGKWLSDSFDWRKTLGKDDLWTVAMDEQSGSPGMQFRVDGERLRVSFFPNRK